MAWPVEWLPAALDDLDAACAFLARNSPAYTASFAREVLSAASSLSELATRGRVVPEVNDESIRELFVHRYRLIYRVGPERVAILALLHGARGFDAAWGARRR